MQQQRWWKQQDNRQQLSPQHGGNVVFSSESPAPAPGFSRTPAAADVSSLPKVWEYEDPLKDVHGPFDAAQIINWFAQDWFDTNLKIRRVNQYWTTLEFVLDELKSEARGTAASARASAGTGASTDDWGSWAPGNSRRDSAVPGRDSAVPGRDSAVPGRDSAVPGRDSAMSGRGVQLTANGKWERGFVIGSEDATGRRAGDPPRSGGAYRDYDAYGDDYGGSGRHDRRERGSRGAQGLGEQGRERAARIPQGQANDDYGVRRGKGRATHDTGIKVGTNPAAGRATGGKRGEGKAPGSASSSSRSSRQACAAAADAFGASPDKEASSAAATKSPTCSGQGPERVSATSDKGCSTAARLVEPQASGGAAPVTNVVSAAHEGAAADGAAAHGTAADGTAADGPVHAVKEGAAGSRSTTPEPDRSKASPASPSATAQTASATLSGVKALIAQREQAAKLGGMSCATPPRFVTPPQSPPPAKTCSGGGSGTASLPACVPPVNNNDRLAVQEDSESLVKSITAAMFSRLGGQ